MTYTELLKHFAATHNAVVESENPTEAQKLRRAFAAMRVLEASRDAAGAEGELDFNAVMAQAKSRFAADVFRPAIVVEAPKPLADGAKYSAEHAEAVAAAEERYKAEVDQTVALAGAIVNTLIGATASGALPL